MKLLEGVTSHPKAVFSDCEMFRYTLWRTASTLFTSDFRGSRPRTYVNFICLNPSTATDDEDDPTVRKCQMLARRWGYDSICVTNIFAYRSTDPKALKKIDYPIGPMNDRYLMNIADRASLAVCRSRDRCFLLSQMPHERSSRRCRVFARASNCRES